MKLQFGNWFVISSAGQDIALAVGTGPSFVRTCTGLHCNGLNNDRNFYKITLFTLMAAIRWCWGGGLSAQCLSDILIQIVISSMQLPCNHNTGNQTTIIDISSVAGNFTWPSSELNTDNLLFEAKIFLSWAPHIIRSATVLLGSLSIKTTLVEARAAW